MSDAFYEYHRYREALLAERGDEVLSLDDIRGYGEAFIGDPEYLRLYGMTPDEYVARGVKLLGRTLIECCIDQYSTVIAAAASRWSSAQDDSRPLGVIDPFMGSGNLLFHVARACGARRAVGLDLHPEVYQWTSQNFAHIGFSAELHRRSHTSALSEMRARPDLRWIVILCPPWGDAFLHEVGLDLRRTSPPIRELMDYFSSPESGLSPLFVVQTSRLVVEASVAELSSAYQCLERQMRHLIYSPAAPTER